MRGFMILVLTAFGLALLSLPTHAIEMEGAYCKFDVKEWRDRQSFWDFLKKGADCEMVIIVDGWGELKLDGPDDLDWKALQDFLDND